MDMRDNRFIIGIGKAEREYSVNGVKYIVGSRFKPIDFNNIKDTLDSVWLTERRIYESVNKNSKFINNRERNSRPLLQIIPGR